MREPVLAAESHLQCRDCGEYYNSREFPKNPGNGEPFNICRQCQKKRQAAGRQRNKKARALAKRDGIDIVLHTTGNWGDHAKPKKASLKDLPSDIREYMKQKSNNKDFVIQDGYMACTLLGQDGKTYRVVSKIVLQRKVK